MPLRVVFAGTPAFSLPCLNALLAARTVELAAVITQPDRAAGRGQRRRDGAVKTLALAHRVPLLQPESWQPAALAELRELRPDLLVVAAYGLRLPPPVLACAPLGCVNLHASLLPRWRGAAPIARAIEAGDADTGISLMRMNANIDTGAVLARAAIPLAADDTAGSLHDKLAALAGEVLTASLPALAADSLPAVAQDERLARTAPRLSKDEAALDWRLPAAVLERKVRAFNPWPVAAATVDGLRLRVLRAAVADSAVADSAAVANSAMANSVTAAAATAPGEIVRADRNGIAIATAAGVLLLREVQKPGGAPMSAAALLNGLRLVPGMRFDAITTAPA